MRQQYLVHGRSLTDLANETGATWATLTNCAQRHNIPLRRSGFYYSRRSPLTEAEIEAAPPLLRSALAKMGGLGWLNDFATASSHPNLKVAAEHLGISRPLLSQRITELEAALDGKPLLTRARSGATMTLTPYGKAVLDATKQIALHGC